MRSVFRFTLWAAILCGIVVGVARATAIRWWRIPTGDPYLEASIAPTLRGGDLVILWRLSAPAIGDLVLCPEPTENGADSGRIVIGRMVAEGGDSIAVKQARIAVNGSVPETEGPCRERKFTVSDPETDREVQQHCSLEAIGSNVHTIGGPGPEVHQPLDEKPVDVIDGQVWLASDNRMFPYDSRDFGAVDVGACKETVVFRLVSEAGYFDSEHRFALIR